MKYHAKQLFLIILPFLFSCQSKKTALDNLAITSKVEMFCPEDGECTTTILKNKSLKIKKDETNQLYYQTEDNLNTSVIHFEYNKKVPEGLQDGNYREEILFEINNSDSKLELENLSLNSVKMIYGRHCFCRGQAGYFFVQNGKLTLNKTSKEVAFNLEFTITEVPQIIKKITHPSK